ncbi:energy-coupling factor transporter transmembrane component T family protein [Edaphobacillus lindanitolerans]|uniref:Energy-coupling factor transporter transmembrane protein EcfT n=1 Tax=Edaphobacillus lindanitolerans TaxID=550447 RepID=A0A1U7PRB4_9BACI|nr:energy-coupling factor transporter transmembrane protein EcfT [Edaphobacillus lindanitolerans]SIT87821.1 energy-coupling factor transport system permease protein [Edaphobacillus lindanitolerans]
MMEKMVFGRYIPGDSFVHRLDPRTKLIFVFIFIAAVFLANSTASYALLLGFTLFAIIVSKVRIGFLIGGLKPVIFLIAFTFLLHIFFTKQGDLLFEFGFIKVYEEGLRQGIYISVRFLVLVLMTSLLTLTTSPISITDGLEVLLGPLKKIRFPVHELALMMSISLRFIPTLMDETDKILKAQLARGSDISSGTMKERVKAVVPLLVPLFVSAFKRAEDLAVAMEVRGYRGGEGRTRYRQLKWDWRDTTALLILLLLIAGLWLLRR